MEERGKKDRQKGEREKEREKKCRQIVPVKLEAVSEHLEGLSWCCTPAIPVV